MIELWIPITLLGTVIQNVRSVRQRSLLGRVSVAGSTYSRFFYGCPMAILLLIAVIALEGRLPPLPSPLFWVYATVGGLAQVLGNALFIKLIRSSNFTVMTTYSKMETVISPTFSFVLLGDRLSLHGIAGMLIAVLGVMVLSAGRAHRSVRSMVTAFFERSALQGVGVGALYAVASTSFRAAALDLGDIGFMLQAFTGLACVATLQALMMGGYLLWTQPPIVAEVVREWRILWWIGFTGVGASACWYCAFALQKTGYVLAVGQVELIFAYIASHFMFKERTNRVEIVGILVTVAGILTVVVSR